jgi:hypothetical protein
MRAINHICFLASVCLLSACMSVPMSNSSFMSTLQKNSSDNAFNTPFEHMMVKKMIKAFGVGEWLHYPAEFKAAYVAVHEFDNFSMTAEEKTRYEKAETEIFALMAHTDIIEKCFRAFSRPPYSVSNIDHVCIDRYGYTESWRNPARPNDLSGKILPWKYKNNIPLSQEVSKFTEKSVDPDTVIRDLDAQTHARYLDMIRNYTVGDWLSESSSTIDVMNLARFGKIHLTPDDLKHSERMVDAKNLAVTTSIIFDCWRVESDGKNIRTRRSIEPPYPECLEFHGYPMSKARIEQLRKQNALPEPLEKIKKSASIELSKSLEKDKESSQSIEATRKSVEQYIERLDRESQKRKEEHEEFMRMLEMKQKSRNNAR